MKNFLAAMLLFVGSAFDPGTTMTLSSWEVDKKLWVDETDTYLPVTAEWTNRVEVADLDGDGRLDLIFANGGNYSEPGPAESTRVFINQGPNKRFREITADVFGEKKFHARVVKVRDVDNDNIPDMLIGTTFQTQSQLYKGLGKGKFKNITATNLPQLNASIGDTEFGDVDDDGDLDIVLTDWGEGSNMRNAGGRTLLWLNNGSGKFHNATASHMPDVLIRFSWDIELVDYDNDFDLDLAISCKRCETSRLFENDGHGVFKDKRILPAFANNYEFEPMDVNDDGFLDMVTVNDGAIVQGDSGSRREHLFLNKNGHSFEDASNNHWPPTENIGMDDNNIVFLDFDSDGDPDFLLSSLTGEDRLLVNDGAGKFTLAQPVFSGKPTPQTLSLVVGDINGDRKLDIIMGQGEGKENLDERIFIGQQLGVDTAPPVIAHHKVLSTDKGVVVMARIHDNKSPNMPQDWQAIVFTPNKDSSPVAMMWYGENLWKVRLSKRTSLREATICATDFSGNKKCVTLKDRAANE